ncbi:MAG: hypothetical protein P1P64_07755 [Treponemataceae bacterium]
MNTFVIILLFVNLGLMAVFFIVTKRNFSQNKYAENMKSEVGKLIGEIQFQTETCVRILEDKIAEANETVKKAESRLEVINAELVKQEKEVVVLDKLMEDNSKKIKKEQQIKRNERLKPAETPTLFDEAKIIKKAESSEDKNQSSQVQNTKSLEDNKESIQIYSDSKNNIKKFSGEHVLKMHRVGVPAEIISKKTGIPLGEVSLIISLSEA